MLERDVLEGFAEPRYAAAAPDGRHAFVSDSGDPGLAVVDVVRARVVGRLRLKLWPRHVATDGRTLWVVLSTAAREAAVVDVRDPRRPRLERIVRPGSAVHDVGVAPDGRPWLTPAREPGGVQHVAFLAGRAFVTSGDTGTVRVEGRAVRVPAGSYNVQRVGRRIVTPSLAEGTLSILDARGRLLHVVPVASSCHDAA